MPRHRRVATGRVSRIEPRAGRPVRHYRAIAEAFLLSLADLAEAIGEKPARELRHSLAAGVTLARLIRALTYRRFGALGRTVR